MENETDYEMQEEPKEKAGDRYMIQIAIVISGVIIAVALVYNAGNRSLQR